MTNVLGRIGSVHFPTKRESLMQPYVHPLSVIVTLFMFIIIIFVIVIVILVIFITVMSRYAVKYNEQLILTLEEDEFSCKQRLAYKLEQVHNIMQGDAQ